MSNVKFSLSTHVYGVAGLSIGATGLALTFLSDNEIWQTYVLILSGWVAAVLYCFILVRSISFIKNISDEKGDKDQYIGRLRGEIESLERTLEQRSATIDFLASLQISVQPIPRLIKHQQGEDE